ncbi:hypothetical protein K450DRAFT_303186 [Umbelopsis ramanniana AG]|uniref:Uncharacterized protein n=1 Tax=Umbelopsis ramanniana AG TaxID=1314678 RepID=A0AAD5HAL8_UMBRA|nr:uncharacterized protein K450DRAFT_303186 [Umbelopsis ramanniana AG]KAI8575879.1 hypothetical protein K450DRAFT_303186 [Umbelopsis ramanniana AG]
MYRTPLPLFGVVSVYKLIKLLFLLEHSFYMASDRFGSVSASHRTKAAEKWFKNATSDAKHKTVDKELQRIKNLGVVSVRKRHEDVASPTSSRRASFISNGSEPSKKKSSSDISQTPATVEDDTMDSPTLSSAPEGEFQQTIESEVSENIELPKVDFSPVMDEIPIMQVVDTNAIETNAMDDDGHANNDDPSANETAEVASPVQPAVSATQDLQRFVDDTHLPDDVAVTFAPVELSKSRPSSEGESTPMSLQPSKRSSNKSTSSSVYSQADSYVSLTVKNLINSHAHASPASSLQSVTSASLPVSCGSPGTVISEMYILVDQAKKASPEQGELAEIHEKLLGLVNSLNVWHAANPADSSPQGDSSEVEDLRKQVKALEHKCELQQVDLHERSAYHSKLMQDKDSLLKKLSSTEGGDYTPSDGSPTDPSPISVKLMNRLSTGSNVSSASLVTNPRSGCRSRRLNPRPETPLPPQLPPPNNPLPPIPQQEPVPHHSIHKEHHEKVVKELLYKLKDQQSKSKSTIDTLEIKLSVMTKQTLELQHSISRLESELQAKQRAPPRSTLPTHSSPKKNQSRRSFSLLTLFGKR